MKEIRVLEQTTIDQIAAGEVVERPSSIVKELCENAIDAGCTVLTIEIQGGGISLIRVTDNGEGIDPSQVRNAFQRHATSKITEVNDLFSIRSFGFRGEALSSIAAVSRVELVTKTTGSLTGIRYQIEGGREVLFEEIGAPEGSTFLIRDLFYNTPARRKFLKSAQAEAGYVSDFVQRLALSRPDLGIRFIVNGQTRLSTSGNGKIADVIYQVFGKETARSLIELDRTEGDLHLSGYLGKPEIARGTRSYEIFFVNGRLIQSSLLQKASEEGFETFLMQHRFPFLLLSLHLPGDKVDVNVHPAKAQVRFAEGPRLYDFVKYTVRNALNGRELIVKTPFSSGREERLERKAEESARQESIKEEGARAPEPFEKLRREHLSLNDTPYGPMYGDQEAIREGVERRAGAGAPEGSADGRAEVSGSSGQEERSDLRDQKEKDRPSGDSVSSKSPGETSLQTESGKAEGTEKEEKEENVEHAGSAPGRSDRAKTQGDAEGEKKEKASSSGSAFEEREKEKEKELYLAQQLSFLSDEDQRGLPEGTKDGELEEVNEKFLTKEHVKEHRLIGQVFGTYWLIEFRGSLFIIDQHAAHEKVLFERLMKKYREKSAASQMISPPVIVTLSLSEEQQLNEHKDFFTALGFEIEPFGDKDIAIYAFPTDLYGLTERGFFLEVLDSLSAETGRMSIETITSAVATQACKAAVKGNTRLSFQEADALIGELLTCENPYNCPHGRPTILSMTKGEIEKKFHRVV